MQTCENKLSIELLFLGLFEFAQARTELHRMLADIAAVGREVVLLLLVNKCDLEEVATLSEVENALGMLDQTAFTMARQKTVRVCMSVYIYLDTCTYM